MCRALSLLGLLVLVAGCAGRPSGRALTYAEVQALNPGVSADWIRAEYPFGRVSASWPDGTPQRMRYPVVDPWGYAQTLDLELDRAGVVTAKRYSGRVLRPPPNQK